MTETFMEFRDRLNTMDLGDLVRQCVASVDESERDAVCIELLERVESIDLDRLTSSLENVDWTGILTVTDLLEPSDLVDAVKDVMDSENFDINDFLDGADLTDFVSVDEIARTMNAADQRDLESVQSEVEDLERRLGDVDLDDLEQEVEFVKSLRAGRGWRGALRRLRWIALGG